MMNSCFYSFSQKSISHNVSAYEKSKAFGWRFSDKTATSYAVLDDVVKSFCFVEWQNDYLGVFFIFSNCPMCNSFIAGNSCEIFLPSFMIENVSSNIVSSYSIEFSLEKIPSTLA